MEFKRRNIVAFDHNSMQTYFDMESEAAWVSFLVPDWSENGKNSSLYKEKEKLAKEKLTRDLGKIGVRVTDEMIDIDVPTKPGDKICTVVFFFKEDEMPSKEQLETVAKEVDIPSADIDEEDYWNKEEEENEQ